MAAISSYTIREKTTNSLVFQLFSDGNAIDLSAIDHIELHMSDSTNKIYRYSSNDTSPAVSVVTAASGIVKFDPPLESVFLYNRSPYKLYWQVWDSPAVKYSIPENTHYELVIIKEY